MMGVLNVSIVVVVQVLGIHPTVLHPVSAPVHHTLEMVLLPGVSLMAGLHTMATSC